MKNTLSGSYSLKLSGSYSLKRLPGRCFFHYYHLHYYVFNLMMQEFKERLAAGDTEDVYYLAGEYEPVLGTIRFKPGVIQ